VRLHPYHTGRILARSPVLAPLGQIASRHHERPDGSGYPAGVGASELDGAACLLAAADVLHALGEPRPHRPALTQDAAIRELQREAEGGRLSPESVSAVLTAAGQPQPATPRPAGLSERECEVLALLARGLATKQIARQLGISPKTCDHHIQSLYAKAGVSTRAAATLFALEHGLVSADPELRPNTLR